MIDKIIASKLYNHKINPIFSGIQDNLDLLKDEFKNSQSVNLESKIIEGYTVGDLLINLTNQISILKAQYREVISNMEKLESNI